MKIGQLNTWTRSQAETVRNRILVAASKSSKYSLYNSFKNSLLIILAYSWIFIFPCSRSHHFLLSFLWTKTSANASVDISNNDLSNSQFLLIPSSKPQSILDMMLVHFWHFSVISQCIRGQHKIETNRVTIMLEFDKFHTYNAQICPESDRGRLKMTQNIYEGVFCVISTCRTQIKTNIPVYELYRYMYNQ